MNGSVIHCFPALVDGSHAKGTLSDTKWHKFILQSAAKIIAEIWSCMEHPEEAQLVRMSYFKNLDLRATEHQVTTAFVACMLCCELEGILESI